MNHEKACGQGKEWETVILNGNSENEESPQQRNNKDCGVAVLRNLR